MNENDKYNKKIELYERNLNEKVKHEGLLQGVCLFNLKLYESRLFKYFNEIVIKNIDKREVAKKNKESAEETNLENFETDEIYFKHNSYYEYNLVGVVVHLGSAVEKFKSVFFINYNLMRY